MTFNIGDRVSLRIGVSRETSDEHGCLWDDYYSFFRENPGLDCAYGTIIGLDEQYVQVFWDEPYHDAMYRFYEIDGIRDSRQYLEEFCGIPPERYQEECQWNLDWYFLDKLEKATSPTTNESRIIRRINKLYKKSTLDFVRAWAR